MAGLRNIKSEFLIKANDSLKFVQNVNNALINEKIILSNSEVSCIYEVSFLKIFTAWEKFLEESFIGYLEGKFTKKQRPRLITKKIGSEKAYALLRGTKQYPDWTKIEDVLTLSSLFFITSNPYDTILRSEYQRLSQMKTIRNAITHISKSSSDGFKKLLRAELASYSISMSPGEFLMQKKLPSEQYLSYYTNLLKTSASFIVQK